MKKILFSFFCLLLLSAAGRGQNSVKVVRLNDELKTKRTKTNLTKYLTTKKWNELFPHRFGVDRKGDGGGKPATDFYSFKAFVSAAQMFPAFLAEGDSVMQKRELAAFLANIAQETSGGWPDAPGGYFAWGLYYVEETDTANWNKYADASKKNYPPVPGKYYYGRGPKQLSWNYNYGQFSEAWYGNKDTLLQHPERLSNDAALSFASALWFWCATQPPKPSCHDVMTGKWKPTPDDIKKGRLPGFGATVNIINGGIECGKASDAPKTDYRYRYYEYFCKYFNVPPGSNIRCTNQKPFGQ